MSLARSLQKVIPVLNMKKSAALVAALMMLGLVTGCSSSTNEQAAEVSELTIYSGRSEEFIAPFFANWQESTGIKLNVRYGDSAELSAQILEEGNNSPADLFLSQDAGSLGAISQAGLFTTLPADVAANIPAEFVAANRQWVGVTGRARVFAYAPDRVKVLPTSVTDLVKPIYKNQIGIAPTNASFQAFLTALIESKGNTFAKTWLEGLQANGVKIYLKNSAIVEAIDKGEISIGLVNHYYTWEVSEALGRDINVKNGFFAPGDLGNLINVSGAGILKTSAKQKAAQDLINYLTSVAAQEKFVTDTHEYSLIQDAKAPTDLPALDAIGAPAIDLKTLSNIKATQDLLIQVGLL
jgi:iron(III) transport system substrate-binding protein